MKTMRDESFTSPAERTAAELRSLYGKFGYLPYKMSKFEEYDLYARNKEFLISDSIITFTDTDGRLMALKPDVTLSIIKNTDVPARGTTKLFYSENVYRVSGRGGRPGSRGPEGGETFREIMQTGLECMGNVDDYCLAEVLLLAGKSMASISDEFVLDVCQLDILFKAVDRISNDPQIQAGLLKCAEEKNIHGIREISGNIGKSPEISAIDTLINLVGLYGTPKETLPVIEKAAEYLGAQAEYEKFKNVLTALENTTVKDKIKVDFSIVSDRNYYSGIAFKGYVNGVPERVLSGGQYDRLMEKFGKKCGAIGFAVYLNTLERLNEGNRPEDITKLVYGPKVAPGNVLKKMEELTAAGEKAKAEAE